MDKICVYLAGSMRGKPDFNFAAFDKAKADLEALGFVVISPADLIRQNEGWKDFPPEDLEMSHKLTVSCFRRNLNVILELCPDTDFIYLLSGWVDSAGANVEADLADILDIDIVCENTLINEVEEMSKTIYVSEGDEVEDKLYELARKLIKEKEEKEIGFIKHPGKIFVAP